jgi:hypothetical protein
MPTPSMGPVTSPVPHPTMKSSGLDADATQIETRRRRARSGPAMVPGRVVLILLLPSLALLPRRRPGVRPVILPRRVIPADTGVAIAVDVMTRECGPSTGLFPRAASCEGTEAGLRQIDIEKKGAEPLKPTELAAQLPLPLPSPRIRRLRRARSPELAHHHDRVHRLRRGGMGKI